MDEYKENTSSKVFTEKEEMLLLNKILEDKSSSFCICISCSMNHLKTLAYQRVHKKNRPYPKSWKKNQQVSSSWLKKFQDRYSEKIKSLFPSVCEKSKKSNQTSTKQSFSSQEILTPKRENALLTNVKIMKTGCICKNCVMKEMKVEVYEIVRDMKMCYPQSWDTDKQADCDWQKGFEQRHRNEILKLSPVCQVLFQDTNQQQSPTSENVFTLKEEQEILEDVLNLFDLIGYCDCISCILYELEYLIYDRAIALTKSYPKSWDTYGHVDYKWLNKFAKRHSSALQRSYMFAQRNNSP